MTGPRRAINDEAGPLWSGKNDSTSGALRDKRPLRRAFYGSYEPFRCAMCDGTEYFELPTDANYPVHPRRECLKCHPLVARRSS